MMRRQTTHSKGVGKKGTQRKEERQRREEKQRQAQRRNENNEQLPKSMLKYLRCCAALPDAKFCVSLGNIKTHLAGREGGKAQGKGSERARTFILGHINTYYRLFELVNEAASAAAAAACDLLLFGQAFP